MKLKFLVRSLILGGMLFFLAKALKDNWQEVAQIKISNQGWLYLGSAIGVTLLAHIWTGWVWSWIFQSLHQKVSGQWAIQVYLKTNIAKYIPGNVWHYYGRIRLATDANIPTSIATLSVLLEPLLLAAAALIVASVGMPQNRGLQFFLLAVVLIAIHPLILNQGLKLVSKLKNKGNDVKKIDHYPFLPLLGELGFLGLRSAGFVLTFWALHPVNSSQIPILISSFSLAWLLGLVVPGAPGGIGVFEATAIALLGSLFSPGLILSVVGLYRLISILAEVIGAGLVLIWDRVAT